LKGILLRALAATGVGSLLLFSANIAFADIDIRTASPLKSATNEARYFASISNCSTLASIQAGTNSELQLFSSDAVQPNLTVPGSCTIAFSSLAIDKLQPVVNITRIDGSVEQHTESFLSDDDVAPILSFDSVSIIDDNGKQILVVKATAQDDTDITYVGFDVTGLRASEIRAAGGVIAEARKHSFASTKGIVRVYPSRDDQQSFSINVPLTTPLSADAIALDAIVLADIVVVDASGNQRAISKIAFTGDDIQETALSLNVSATTIVINNALQVPVITPSVNFQFRGLVNLSGPGNGIRYESSHPDLIGITQGGVVFALEETGSELVTISLRYQNLPVIEIPVIADFTKQIVGIEFVGVSSGSPFVLPRLNTYYPLPELQGVFDDGTRTIISGNWQPIFFIDPALTPFLDQNRKGELLSRTVIASSFPAEIQVGLEGLPALNSLIPVVAIDGPPNISMKLPAQVQVQNELRLTAMVEDDVAIANVRFLLDGASIGTRDQVPYELVLPIAEELEGRTLVFSAVVTDSVGQQQSTIDFAVQVKPKYSPVVPEFEFVSPIDGSRVVEGTPVTFLIEHDLGEVSKADSSSGISYTEFYFDGAKVAEALYPGFQVREILTPKNEIEEHLFEIWKAKANTPNISTTETSVAAGAAIHSGNGGQELAPTKLIRVIENSAPIVKVLRPVEGAIATVGQDLKIDVEVTDETLSLGTVIQLFVDDQLVESRLYSNQENLNDSFSTQTTIETFSIPIIEEQIGSTLGIRFTVVDFNQVSNTSNLVRVPVKGDQPPTVAISNPVEGASFVSGLPVQLRAEATDDLGVKKVDFYVNSQLVGSDARAPYSFDYDTQEGIVNEQTLTIHAVVTDSNDQEAKSNIVNVILGHDEEPPVINLSSPTVTGTDSGDDIAGVIEESEVVIKATGFDNVGVEKVELRGVRRDGIEYVLTGVDTDILTEQDFPVQQIPGVLRAYSALRLVRAPAFSGQANVAFDRYPISITAFDEIGNQSTAEIIIGVYADQAPEVSSITSDRSVYFSKEILEIDILAKDDRSVERLDITYLIDGVVVASRLRDRDNNLTPMAIVQVKDTLALRPLNLPNAAATITVRVRAYDLLAQQSIEFSRDFSIAADSTGPLAAISSPAQGSALYSDTSVAFSWRAVDETGVESIEAVINGVSVFQNNLLSGKQETGVFDFTIPQGVGELSIDLNAADVHGNATSTNWRFDVGVNQAPLISIRHPAPGSRLVEGENFTINAQISDDQSIQSVEIFVEESGVSKFSKSFSAEIAAQLIASGDFFSASLRVPHKPDSGSLVIGVRATDNSGIQTTQVIDLIILDDLEPPVVSFIQPENDFSIFPNDAFEVSGIVSDNLYVAEIEPVFVDGDGVETVLEWEVLSRNDRLERIQVSNSGSFGSVIAAERFFSDYSGRIRIPGSFIDRAGEAFDLKMRAKDLGINTTDSLSIKVTIKDDVEGPVISILSPGDTLVDRQELDLQISITDNLLIEEYIVSVIDTETNIILSATSINASEVSIVEKNIIDLTRYMPIPPQGTLFTLTVTAKDTRGNQTTETQVVNVLPDAAPSVVITSKVPDQNLVKGERAFQTFTVQDDYLDDIAEFSGLYTSLTTLTGTGLESRRVVESNINTTVYDTNNVGVPVDALVFSLAYPEAGNWVGEVIVNGRNYAAFANGEMTVFANENINTMNSLLISFPGIEVNYLIESESVDPCAINHKSEVVTHADLLGNGGVLRLSDYLDVGATYATITPEFVASAGVTVPDFIYSIRLDLDRLPNTTNYQDGAANKKITHYDTLQLIVKDSGAESGRGFVHVSPAVTYHSTEVDIHRYLPTMVNNDYSEFDIWGAATDRFSSIRGPVSLSPLTREKIQEDEFAPTLTIIQPTDGASVVAGQRIEVLVDAEDNTGGIDTIVLSVNGIDVVQVGGVFDKEDSYRLIYEVPKELSGGVIDLSVVASDSSGRTASQQLVLPVGRNEVPELSITGFDSYLVNGQFQKNIRGADRLNLGEFFLRIGETFQLTTELVDDAGIESYVINRRNRDGSITIEYREDFLVPCPDLLITRVKTQENSFVFNQSEPTEYEVILTDNTGQISRREFLIHPISNVAPEVRITVPIQDQFIVAGTFKIQVGVVASDDRALSRDKIKLFANGIEISLQSSLSGSPGSQDLITNAYNDIYDSFESKYSVGVADDYGSEDSPYATEFSGIYEIPSGLIRFNEEIELTVQIKDSDNSIGTHRITFLGAADEINPEVALLEPNIGFGPPEASDFTVRYRAFDNVKVEQLNLYRSYGVQREDGSYELLPVTTVVRSINSIRSVDHEPITSNNVDTPIYTQLVHVDRLAEIAALFPAVTPSENVRYDIWLRMEATDASGNSRIKDVSYPIRIDERPVVDIIAPLDGSRQVEDTNLLVNVNAYDDVGVDSLRLVARQGQIGRAHV